MQTRSIRAMAKRMPKFDRDRLLSEGWKAYEGKGFDAHLGPYWFRVQTRGQPEMGFYAGDRHLNQAGTVHGGALMTFADVALGLAAFWAAGAKSCVTAQLQIHLVSAPEAGEFVSCRPELVRCTSQLVFVRGLIVSRDRVVANSDGMWKIRSA